MKFISVDFGKRLVATCVIAPWALVYHLDHPVMPRPHLAENKARLAEVLRSGRARCEQGVQQYLTTGPLSPA